MFIETSVFIIMVPSTVKMFVGKLTTLNSRESVK